MRYTHNPTTRVKKQRDLLAETERAQARGLLNGAQRQPSGKSKDQSSKWHSVSKNLYRTVASLKVDLANVRQTKDSDIAAAVIHTENQWIDDTDALQAELLRSNEISVQLISQFDVQKRNWEQKCAAMQQVIQAQWDEATDKLREKQARVSGSARAPNSRSPVVGTAWHPDDL